jgi:superfamily I DNA/RNA helicase
MGAARSAESPSLADFLSHAALEDPGVDDEQGGRVTLATIHAAKGLEFRSVRVIGMQEGVLPHHRSIAGAALEAERRLCYVAMTRAKQRLVVSWAERCPGRPAVNESRFAGKLTGRGE